MGRYKRLPRKKADRTDEFISIVDKIARFSAKYKFWVISVVAIVAVVWIGSILISQKKERDLVAINVALTQAEKAEDKADAYQKIIQQFGGYEIASLAHLLLADHYLKEGKDTEALQEINKSLDNLPDFLVPLNTASKTKFLWNEGRLTEAYKAIESANGDYSLFLKAQILEQMGKTDEAVELYKDLIKSAETAPLVQQGAMERLVRLKNEE